MIKKKMSCYFLKGKGESSKLKIYDFHFKVFFILAFRDNFRK